MFRRKKRISPTRAELIERKHQLEGQVNVLAAELRRKSARGQPTGSLEARFDHFRSLHYQARLQIDRADPYT